jgi:hypothetical protein
MSGEKCIERGERGGEWGARGVGVVRLIRCVCNIMDRQYW